ncbi:MAG TPA: hypothetical protein VFP49_01215 [Nitrososphaeraceae archaeon]|jgi:hypothetical protein|nr:hypothetical protein [Nitrososphaeraceae archaeon]
MISSNTNTNSNNNKKVLYQLWTNGRGSFAVRKEEGIQLFEYSHSQQSYSKVIDSKMLYDGSITEKLVQDWIEELIEADILDEDGKLIYVEF